MLLIFVVVQQLYSCGLKNKSLSCARTICYLSLLLISYIRLIHSKITISAITNKYIPALLYIYENMREWYSWISFLIATCQNFPYIEGYSSHSNWQHIIRIRYLLIMGIQLQTQGPRGILPAKQSCYCWRRGRNWAYNLQTWPCRNGKRWHGRMNHIFFYIIYLARCPCLAHLGNKWH